MSWGDAEYGSIFKGYETNDDGYFNNKAGVTFLAATGDNGHPGQYPAYSPDVIAVGGTSLHLYANDTVASELPWSGSGGGVSQYESEPVYQELGSPAVSAKPRTSHLMPIQTPGWRFTTLSPTPSALPGRGSAGQA